MLPTKNSKLFPHPIFYPLFLNMKMAESRKIVSVSFICYLPGFFAICMCPLSSLCFLSFLSLFPLPTLTISSHPFLPLVLPPPHLCLSSSIFTSYPIPNPFSLAWTCALLSSPSTAWASSTGLSSPPPLTHHALCLRGVT